MEPIAAVAITDVNEARTRVGDCAPARVGGCGRFRLREDQATGPGRPARRSGRPGRGEHVLAKSFTFTYSARISAGGRTLTMTGAGLSDLEHGLVAMKLRFDGVPGAAAANGEVVLDSSGGLVEYLHMAALDGQLPPGKSWVKVDVGAIGKKYGVDLSQLRRGGNADPTRMLSFLQRAADPTVVGHETVGGVATTHYEATVDLQRLVAAETDATTRANLQRAIDLAGISSYPVEAWVDDAGYLRRMRLTIPQVSDATHGAVVTIEVTEELSDFGTPVRVDLPPEASVVDVADLVGSRSLS
jgi:hypothetical protein